MLTGLSFCELLGAITIYLETWILYSSLVENVNANDQEILLGVGKETQQKIVKKVFSWMKMDICQTH